MPTPLYGTGVQTTPAIFSSFKSKDPAKTDVVTEEVVESIGSGGDYIVLGYSVPTRTSLQIDAGDAVLVKWRGGVPILILDVKNRRGTGVDTPEGTGGVEELIAAPSESFVGPAFPNTDIWFRNGSRVDLLNIRELLGKDTVGFESSRGWGPSRRHFLLVSSGSAITAGVGHGGIFVIAPGSAVFYVIKLAGSPNSTIDKKPHATLLETIDAKDSELMIGTFTMENTDSPPRPTVVTDVRLGQALAGYEIKFPDNPSYAGPDMILTANLMDAFLNKKNEVIATFEIELLDVFFLTRRWTWPVVVNLTQNVFLFNGVAAGVGGVGAPAGVISDGQHFDYFLDSSTSFKTWTRLHPLVNRNGDMIAAVVWEYYTRTAGDEYFAAYLCSVDADVDSVSVVRTIVPLQTVVLDQFNRLSNQLEVISSNQRYVLWTHTTRPVQATVRGPIHMADFTTLGMPDTEAISAADADAFMENVPTLMVPSLLYLSNPPPAIDQSTVDTLNEFAKFRVGSTITLSQPPAPLLGSEDAAELKKFSGISAHIPSFYVILDSITSQVRYQLIPGQNFNPPSK